LGATCRLKGESNLEAARKHPVSAEVLREQFDRLGETIYCIEKLNAVIEGSPMVPLSVLGSLRREMIEKLNLNEPVFVQPDIHDNALQLLRNENKSVFENRNQNNCPVQHFLLRDVRLFENDSFLRQITESGCRSFYAELREMDEFKIAADAVRKLNAEFVAVLPRILKPGESGILKKFADLEPDAVLVRNLEEIAFFRDRNVPMIADFSFNVINDLSFRQLLDWGAERITLGWDLDEKQAEELLQYVPAEKIERIIAGRMPLFTMEHCLWRANLVKPGEPCNQLCRTRPLQIRDRRGAIHPVRSDMFCRNFVENAELIELKTFSPIWQHFRIEWDNALEGTFKN
jgi:putative protease